MEHQERATWGGVVANAIVSAALLLPRMAWKLSSGDAKMGSVEEEEVFLRGSGVLVCVCCLTHVSSHDDIVSKCFHGREGRAFLMSKAVNVSCDAAQDRLLMTGLHRVCDVRCRNCQTVLGWKYVSALWGHKDEQFLVEHAYEESQKYKIGKYVLEKANLSTAEIL